MQNRETQQRASPQLDIGSEDGPELLKSSSSMQVLYVLGLTWGFPHKVHCSGLNSGSGQCVVSSDGS